MAHTLYRYMSSAIRDAVECTPLRPERLFRPILLQLRRNVRELALGELRLPEYGVGVHESEFLQASA